MVYVKHRPHSLMACSSLQMATEFRSSIFDEDYKYFSGKVEVVRQEDLAELAH